MKADYSLLPANEIEQVVQVLTFGAIKHSPNGWQNVPKHQHMAAAMRHVFAHQRGLEIDDETGKSHLAHAVCRLLFAMWHESADMQAFTPLLAVIHNQIAKQLVNQEKTRTNSNPAFSHCGCEGAKRGLESTQKTRSKS